MSAWASISSYNPDSPAFDKDFHDWLQTQLAEYTRTAASVDHDEETLDDADPWIAALNAPISADELKAAKRRLKNNTRGGDGEWTYELLKNGGEVMDAMLLSLLQLF